MHWWEVVLLFVGVPLLLCAVVTAVVFFFFTTPDRDSLRPGAGWSATSSSAEESCEPPHRPANCKRPTPRQPRRRRAARLIAIVRPTTRPNSRSNFLDATT